MKNSTRATFAVCAIAATAAVTSPPVTSVFAFDASTHAASAPFTEAQPALFVPISHFRAIDSRTFEPSASAKMEVGAEDPGDEYRLVDLARRAGDDFFTRVVPAGATAVSFNITVVQTEGRGFLHVDAPQLPDSESATVNWTGDGQTVSNSSVTIVGTTDAEVVLFAGLSIGGEDGASAHYIIDVTGYYVPAITP